MLICLDEFLNCWLCIKLDLQLYTPSHTNSFIFSTALHSNKKLFAHVIMT